MIYMSKKVHSEFVPSFHFRIPISNSYTNHTKDLDMVSETWQISANKTRIGHILIISEHQRVAYITAGISV